MGTGRFAKKSTKDIYIYGYKSEQIFTFILNLSLHCVYMHLQKCCHYNDFFLNSNQEPNFNQYVLMHSGVHVFKKININAMILIKTDDDCNITQYRARGEHYSSSILLSKQLNQYWCGKVPNLPSKVAYTEGVLSSML